MNAAFRFVATILFAACVLLGVATAEDWPGFRGSHGGVSSETNLPVQWTKDNILWKVKVPGVGTSSPITYGDKVFITAYTGYGTTITKGFGGGKGGKGGGKGGFGGAGGATGDQKNLKLLLLCYDAVKGTLDWKKEIEPKLPEVPFTGFIREHGYASSTPVTDGANVYAFFGKSGVVAYDMKGMELWRADVGSKTDKWGSAASPVLFKNLLIINACIESGSLIALDKSNGKEVWRKKGIATCWVSPAIVETKEGKQELVMNLPGKVVAYDPASGDELWHCQGIGGGGTSGYTGATPVSRDGVVYVMGGGGPGAPATSMAIKTGGKGDITKTHLLWKQKAGANLSSPVLSGDSLVWVNGDIISVNCADGKINYKDRLYGGKEYVSAVAAGDKIFALTRTEGLFVLGGGDKFAKLSHFDFAGDASIFNASPAISNGRIYLRSNEYLYCVGKK